jgi:AcrR family transcriptional regulator
MSPRAPRALTVRHDDRLAARRRPRQARSQATVEAILIASRRVLIRDGYAGFTTQRVAEVAGVGIGSLYEYFRSKDALLSALVDDFLGTMASTVMASMGEVDDMERAIGGVIAALLEVKTQHQQLNRILLEELPRVHGSRRLEVFNRQMEPLLAAYLGRFRPDLPAAVLERASFVLVHSVQGVLTETVRTGQVTDVALVDDLRALVTGYLRSLPDSSE